jgi:hypothetical protein
MRRTKFRIHPTFRYQLGSKISHSTSTLRLQYFSLIVGCSIGTIQGGNVVVDDSLSTAYEAQPGRQEWVTVIESRGKSKG